MYYEMNLPAQLSHLAPGSRDAATYKNAVLKLQARTDKLNRTLDMLQIQPEMHQKLCAELFKSNPARFDALSTIELADYINIVYDSSHMETRLDWPNAKVLFDTAFATNDEWVCIRKYGLGGSNTEVTGENTHKTCRETFYEKRGIPVKHPAQSTIPLQRGHFCEDNVIETYCHLTGAVRLPETRMFASIKYPHCIADLDGIIRTKDGKIQIFEAKTSIAQNFDAWANNRVPRTYLQQCRHYPGVLNDDRIDATVISCMFVQDFSVGDSLFGVESYGQNATRIIERDKDAEEDLLKQKETFWTKYIEAGVLPPDSGSSEKETSLLDAVNGYNPAKPPLEWKYDTWKGILEAYMKADEEYSRLKAKEEAAKELRDQHRQSFIDKLGDAPYAVMDMGNDTVLAIKYAPPKPKVSIDLESFKYAYPDVYYDLEKSGVIAKTEQAKRFSISEKTRKAFEKAYTSFVKSQNP